MSALVFRASALYHSILLAFSLSKFARYLLFQLASLILPLFGIVFCVKLYVCSSRYTHKYDHT